MSESIYDAEERTGPLLVAIMVTLLNCPKISFFKEEFDCKTIILGLYGVHDWPFCRIIDSDQ